MRWLSCMALLVASGCEPGPPPDSDAGEDAASASGGAEGGVDAGDDATVVAADAEIDAGTDAGPACLPSSCVALGVCETAACIDDVCVHTPVADGTVCDEVGAMLCVGGSCVMRGCGDGWREPGPAPAREGCDDGNVVGGDACTARCAPRIFTIQSRTDKLDELPAMAADRSGALLAAWTAQIGVADPTVSLRARRFDPRGVPLDAHGMPLDIATDVAFGWPFETTVAGLDAGWVVAWSAPDGDGDLTGVRYALVASDGTVGAARTANETVAFVQSEPSLAPLTDGFVVSWTDESGADADVRARRFNAAGVSTGHELAVASTAAGNQRSARVASASAPPRSRSKAA